MTQRKVTILRGLPGSGKSTWVKQHASGALVVSADHFFEDKHGNYVFHPELLPQAHQECLRAFVVSLVYDFKPHTVVDNTSIKAIEIAPYVALAQAYDCDVEIVTLLCPVGISVTRNKHGVPRSTIEAMFDNMAFQESIFPAWWSHRRVQWGEV